MGTVHPRGGGDTELAWFYKILSILPEAGATYVPKHLDLHWCFGSKEGVPEYDVGDAREPGSACALTATGGREAGAGASKRRGMLARSVGKYQRDLCPRLVKADPAR